MALQGLWGQDPTPRYADLAAPFRPIFAHIAEGALERELGRTLPHEPLAGLKEAKFGALRLAGDEGGQGAGFAELAALIIELAEADSNVAQALRGHFGFVEDVINRPTGAARRRWTERFARGEITGNAWTEIGDARVAAFLTRVTERDGQFFLDGAKYYTTGSLFADWIDVGATSPAGERIAVAVPRHAAGVAIEDDWDGFGQTLTASGTTVFTNVRVSPDDIVAADQRFRYSPAFFQFYHLATLVGIGRALTRDLSQAVAARRRTYTHAAAARSSDDPQVLQVVGRVRSAAYAAGAIVFHTARALDRAFAARLSDDAAEIEDANATAELEVAQAQTVVSDLILQAATIAFDALGASATKKSAGLDRHWRNARTLASHNPRIYKDRIVGDFSVNGTPPPYQWRTGEA
ncbi:acyl-CoA dehydrogenase family protein [Chelatococcus reniformis]|uniref:Acyl-CoA dehydrogenase n=1 Tax=Chelatococcus reniformis TaxID=1494448 RepID=A0A916U0J9_9HYPH|nr:acyl-CoA dehydrogenase family protein [Chelatococcus reniformis]GGC53228.1 acyl-CoA dehydrogenase [Chelatococcus reniformis]